MSLIRFIHTADWQLGMTRHFFSAGVQERYSQDRFDAIRRLGQVAKEEECDFVLVCGDVFESNQVERSTVARACEALKEVPVPVYLLPGNHDPLNAASVYHSSTFSEQCPAHVQVISDDTPRTVTDGVELIGAPWKSKKPVVNPLDEVLRNVAPSDSIVRLVMGHGILDTFTPDKDAPAVITAKSLEEAVGDGRATYVALGDRHSVTKLGASGRVCYSGSPEATDFREEASGYALLVEVSGDVVTTRDVQVGQWAFVEQKLVELNHGDDIVALADWIGAIDNKERTVLRLRLVGSLTIALHANLQKRIEVAKDLFAGLDVRYDKLAIVPDDTDFAALGFSGFADKTVAILRSQIEAGGADAVEARDALLLLVRLAEGAA